MLGAWNRECMHALFSGLLDICTTYRHVSSAMIICNIREGEFCLLELGVVCWTIGSIVEECKHYLSQRMRIRYHHEPVAVCITPYTSHQKFQQFTVDISYFSPLRFRWGRFCLCPFSYCTVLGEGEKQHGHTRKGFILS